MLTILNDPHGATGAKRVPLDCGISLQENIQRHLASGYECELRINGVIADPLTDARLHLPPALFDDVVVVRRPEGAMWIAIAVLAAITVATYLMMPKPPAQDAMGKESPNNKLTGQTNVARAYQGVPDVYGSRRVWPDLIQPSVVEYIDQLKYVTEWMCISRGRGDVTDVRYADTPITDIDGASFEVLQPAGAGYPEHGTTTVHDIYEAFGSDEVNGQELSYASPGRKVSTLASISGSTITVPDDDKIDQIKARSVPFPLRVRYDVSTDPESSSYVTRDVTVTAVTVSGGNAQISTTGAALDNGTRQIDMTPLNTEYADTGPFTLPVTAAQIWWNVVFLRGLKGSVQIKTEWWQIDADGAEMAGTREDATITYSRDTFDQMFFTEKVTPAAGAGRYRVQFTRLTPQQGDQGTDVAKLESLSAVRRYPTRTFPGVTLIRVTTKATIAATGFSERKFNLRWARHVRTLSSDALGHSRNFARAMAHIWTLAGNSLAGLDADALTAINSKHGEDSPLLRFDGSMDDADMSLGERLQLVADHARCRIWRNGQRWTVTRDEARSIPEMQLDYRNLSASGDPMETHDAHLPASHDGVELEYVDEAEQKRKAYVRLNITSGVPVPGISVNPKKVSLPGCTSQAQAENRAQLEARKLLYQRAQVQDTALAEAATLGLGALVRWIDPHDFYADDGLQAGEVLAISNGNTITSSEALDWQGQTAGRILLTGADGAYLGAPIVCTPAAGGAVLASMPAGVYAADGFTRQLGSRYVFAVGLTDAELASAGLYEVRSVKPDGRGDVQITLANYDPRVYEAD